MQLTYQNGLYAILISGAQMKKYTNCCSTNFIINWQTLM